MNWKLEFTSKARKQLKKLPALITDSVLALIMDLENDGPLCNNWPNFSKLGTYSYHCHVKKGRPTYVVCWRIADKKNKEIEVYYVGTHEKAPY